MDERGLVAYLVRVAIDNDFRKLALTDPDASFDGYELDDDDKEVLRRRDDGLFGVVARAVREQLGMATSAPDESRAPALEDAEGDVDQGVAAALPAAPDVPSGRPLPEVAVMLRLTPYAEGETVEDLRVRYVASMHPVARPAQVDDVELVPIMSSSAVDTFGQKGVDADIAIVGLGMTAPDHLTREAERLVREANEVLYLDTGIATAAFLETMTSNATPLFRGAYKDGAPRIDAYNDIASAVVEAAADHAPVVFAIHGHPLVAVTAPFEVATAASERGLTVRVVPGISSLDCLFADLGVDPVVSGIQMFEATDLLLRRRPMHPDVPVVIWQAGTVESRLHTSRPNRGRRFVRLRDHLLRYYPPEHALTIYHAPMHPLVPVGRTQVPVRDLAGEVHADELHAGTTLYIPPAFERPAVDAELLDRVDDPAHLRNITR